MCDDFAPSLVAALGQAIFGVSNVEQTRMRTDLLHQTSSECRVGQNHLLNEYLLLFIFSVLRTLELLRQLTIWKVDQLFSLLILIHSRNKQAFTKYFWMVYFREKSRKMVSWDKRYFSLKVILAYQIGIVFPGWTVALASVDHVRIEESEVFEVLPVWTLPGEANLLLLFPVSESKNN